jgi:hypothetical protein
MKQLINLTLFCKKVNIPFEVYAFMDGSDDLKWIYEEYGKLNKGDLILGPHSIVNILSSRMKSADFTYASAALMYMSGVGQSRRYCPTPRFMRMSGTPLNQAIISAMEVVPEFQKRNRLQIVNTVFLTDGEGGMLNRVFDEPSGYTTMVIRDPKTKFEEVFDRASEDYRYNANMTQTDCLIRLLKARTKSHVIGLFVGDGRDVGERIFYFFPHTRILTNTNGPMDEYDKIKAKFRESDYLIADNTGFDDYYILRSASLDINDDEELSFSGKSTTRGMVAAFSKYTGNKITSRVILNRFIGLIT